MAYTQVDINNIVNGIINRFTGKTIAFPDGRYPGECTAPVVWYLQTMGYPVPPMYNSRADGWGVAFPEQLAPYFIHETFQAGKNYPRGTLLMWNSPHIAILLQVDGGNTMTVFEQNADPDGSPCGTHTRTMSLPPWHEPTYAMIPIMVPDGPPYTITAIPSPGRNLRINKEGALMYNLGLRDFDAVLANPVGRPDEGYTFVAEAMLVHPYSTHPTSDYFLPDASNPVGFWSGDCDDYDPTPPPPPAPYVPPAAPVPVKRAEKYTLVADVPTYQTYLNALNGASPIGKLAEGSYYIYTTSNDMLNLSDDNMHEGLWVNPKENVAPLLPTPPPEAVGPQVVTPSEPTSYLPSEVPIGTQADTTWKASYKSFHPDGSPDIYELLADYVMSDYSGQRKPIQLSEGKRINVPGTFVKDGVMFYCPRDYKNDVTFSRRYGVPMFDDAGNPMMRKIVEEPLPQHFADLFRLWRNDISNYLGSKPVWDILWHKSKNNKGVKK